MLREGARGASRLLRRRRAWNPLVSLQQIRGADASTAIQGLAESFKNPSHLPTRPRLPYCPLARGFATKAEEYDLIAADSRLAVIEGYDKGGFTVNGAYHEGSVMCSGSLITLWKVAGFADLSEEAFSILLLMKPSPDLLILGCGPRIEQLPSKLLEWLADNGIAVECLDTANAVSTFNILNQEGRKVVAALVPFK